jgi:phosphoglycolate phosphatase-like HAD superfamily hydrolase
LQKSGLLAVDVIAVGDEVKDIECARAANVRSAAALWGSVDPQAVIGAGPDMVFRTVATLADVLLG